MKNIFVRTLCLTCLLLGGLTLMSCENNKAPSSNVVVIEGQPDYTGLASSNVLRIGAWVSPTPGNWNNLGNPDLINLEQYQAVKDSGINVIYALYEFDNLDATTKSVQLATDVGIKYLARNTSFNVDPDALELEAGEFADRASAYSGLEGFAGHLICDEPGDRKSVV